MTIDTTTLHVLHGAATAELGPGSPKATTMTAGQEERSVTLWTSEDGRSTSGVWEATPGSFTSTREGFHEACQLVAGRVSIESADGTSTQLVAGDLFVTPEGWAGTWHVHETARKAWVIISTR